MGDDELRGGVFRVGDDDLPGVLWVTGDLVEFHKISPPSGSFQIPVLSWLLFMNVPFK